MITICYFKNSDYICSVKEMVVTYYVGQAVNLPIAYLGIFLCPLCKYIGGCLHVKFFALVVDHFFDGVYGDRYFYVRL